MPKRPKKVAGRKATRRVVGRGAYYPGGMTLRGRGGFFQDLGNGLKKIAGPLIGAVGGVANTVFPGAGMVANGIRQLIGAGAYSPVRSNTILAQPVPRVNSSQDVGVTYSHCEFLGDVTGSEDWELTQFHVNPGLPEVFPWLSGVASNFQKYKITGLVFYIRSTSSVAIASDTNLGLGTVLGGFQTNVYDKAPASKLEFLSLSGARSGKPSEDHIFPMECDRSKNVFSTLLVRTVGVQDDLAKYDHAVFNLATVGFPGSYYLGELWVSYQLTLMAPKVEAAVPSITTRPASGPNERLFTGALTNLDGSLTFIQNPPLSDATQVLNTAGWTNGLDTAGHNVLVVPAGTIGYFLVKMHAQYSGLAASAQVYAVAVVRDNTGTATIDNTTIWPLLRYSNTGSGPYSQDVVAAVVVKIETLPDRPMKLILGFHPDTSTTVTTGIGSIDIIRMPDKIFASSSSSSTVSLAQKVQRIAMKRNTVARSGLTDFKEGSDSTDFVEPASMSGAQDAAPTLAPPDLVRQRVTLSLGQPSLRNQR